MLPVESIKEKLNIFSGNGGGIDSWLSCSKTQTILESLKDLEKYPLTRARFNQLLTLAHEAPISEAMFKYYWLSSSADHPYDVTAIPEYDESWINSAFITSIDQFYWGMYRFYVDALLYFGSIRTAYQTFRELSDDELKDFFKPFVFRDAVSNRGLALDSNTIPKDDRYLISEMACKSYEIGAKGETEITKMLLDMYKESQLNGRHTVSIRQLLTGENSEKYKEYQMQLELSADDYMEETIQNEEDIKQKVGRVSDKFKAIHTLALDNTEKYLSMVGDLDVYVATSMRTRYDFRTMADFCERVFGDERLKSLNIRYFDPTLSAARHHEDKGLIECLMVKCAKALVMHAGARDSFGKDAEATMALSLGKPVVIFCNEEGRKKFFKEVHPLSRLIHFDTGVAVGALVTSSERDVSELLYRTLTNKMQYVLEQREPGYLILKEKLTNCIVRLQTNDDYLRETFWNYYHHKLHRVNKDEISK
ncbi:MAG: hypothetical protein A2Z15_06065 [Chloroflexi bacterium RBG_16_50_11]|nr:MAG: hypothetical protein A2Z15_06065 [Chloroflexi bacterium RBG_16_50_11]